MIYEGRWVVGAEDRYAVVVARFNESITKNLLSGALDTFGRLGADVGKQVDVAWVPGSFELPLAVERLASTGRYAAVVALGCVIRGATSHHEAVGGSAASGLASVAQRVGLPVAFGVLTTETIEQAVERSGTKLGNAGERAVLTAVEMVDLLRRLGS